MGEKVPLIARAVGGRVLGPRPGKAIITFWQGIVEIILRTVVTVLALAAVIPAGIALSHDGQNVEDEIKGASLLVLGVGLLSVVLELCFIILRFANVGVINYKIRWVLIADSALSGVLSVLFLAGGCAAAYAANECKRSHVTVSHALIAASVFSFFAMFAQGFLGAWSLIFMLNKWNKHVVTYTLKDAILG